MLTNTNQVPARTYAAVECILEVDIEFIANEKRYLFAAGSKVTVDLNENIGFAQGVHFSLERDEFSIPN